MADSSADIYQLNGTEVSTSPQAIDFTTGLDASDSQGTLTVKVKDSGIGTTQIADAGVTPVKYIINEARTATADGTGTGQISATTTHVTVTSADANNIITLPAPVVGKHLTINVGATGFELRSSAPNTIAINGGTGSAGESAIAANSTCYLICVSATAWKGFFLDADSDVAKIEAAAN
jgi:organic hydroperoxide reductase OsmC/OhrA